MRVNFVAVFCVLSVAFGPVAPRFARADEPEAVETTGVQDGGVPAVECADGQPQVCFTCGEARDLQAALDGCAADVALSSPPPCEHESEVPWWAAAGSAMLGAIVGVVVVVVASN